MTHWNYSSTPNALHRGWMLESMPHSNLVASHWYGGGIIYTGRYVDNSYYENSYPKLLSKPSLQIYLLHEVLPTVLVRTNT